MRTRTRNTIRDIDLGLTYWGQQLRAARTPTEYWQAWSHIDTLLDRRLALCGHG